MDHGPAEPHNAQSLYYQYRFYGLHGRWPTWADAIAHCAPDVAAVCARELRTAKAWSEPPAGVAPIAEPQAVAKQRTQGNCPT